MDFAHAAILDQVDAVGAVDWPLLLLFACLFVVTHAFAGTGLAQEAIASLEAAGLLPDTLAVMAPLALIASNSIGNVPFVILLLAIWPAPAEGALYGLALLSTLAGNLLITGSLANIIVAERAHASGVEMSCSWYRSTRSTPSMLSERSTSRCAPSALWLKVFVAMRNCFSPRARTTWPIRNSLPA